MVFAGYNFSVMYDESILLDSELKPEQLKMKEGDTFVVVINESGRIVLKKQNG